MDRSDSTGGLFVTLSVRFLEVQVYCPSVAFNLRTTVPTLFRSRNDVSSGKALYVKFNPSFDSWYSFI
ncbi:MAG: hypothetical protein A4E46_00953 [Methanosaeta sp. PtaU1.Bin016]|nr:MAG: hypothetical protein A4E46_00953 [Methanosaeta sp. PtaU1.Bin016]